MSEFPELRHIDEIRAAIAGRTDFALRECEGYAWADYLYAQPDTFDCPIRRECRGIKFAPDGSILARPFQKFFNVGERPETQPNLIDVSQPHVVMDKLDGSMVHPAIVGGELVFMTRKGITHVSRQAREYAETIPGLLDWCLATVADGLTPIFEWCSPSNLIVIVHREPSLTLLAIRDTATGAYLADDGRCPAPSVLAHDPISDMQDFLAVARDLRGAEGFVVRFHDGLMLKIKAAEYVLRHKAKDGIGLEKNALAVVLGGTMDDVLAMLPDSDRQALESYAAAVTTAVDRIAGDINQVLATANGCDRKTFAVEHAPKIPDAVRGVGFGALDGRDVRQGVVAALTKATSSSSAIERVRPLLGVRWDDYYSVLPE